MFIIVISITKMISLRNIYSPQSMISNYLKYSNIIFYKSQRGKEVLVKIFIHFGFLKTCFAGISSIPKLLWIRKKNLPTPMRVASGILILLLLGLFFSLSSFCCLFLCRYITLRRERYCAAFFYAKIDTHNKNIYNWWL